jgi:hypothetical protein
LKKKSDAFFKNIFFTDRVTYLKMIQALVNSINVDGENYSAYLEMAKSSSMIESSFTSSAESSIKKQYQANRKKLVNHVSFLQINSLIILSRTLLKTKTMANKFGFSFSWKRALGITSAKQKFARETGIPTTKSGLEKKIGSSILKLLFGKK